MLPLILAALAKTGLRAYQENQKAKTDETNRAYLESQKKLIDSQLKLQDAAAEAQQQRVAMYGPQGADVMSSKNPLETLMAQIMLGGGFGGGAGAAPAAAYPGAAPARMMPQGPDSTMTGAQMPELPSLVSTLAAKQAAPAAAPVSSPFSGGGSLTNNPLFLGMMDKTFGVKGSTRTEMDPNTGKVYKYDVNGMTGQEIPGSRTLTDVKQPPTMTTEDVIIGGKKFRQDLDPITHQPVGEPRPVEFGTKQVDAMTANNIALTKNALTNLNTAMDELWKGGAPTTMDMVFGKLGVPGTKGEVALEAWNRTLPVFKQILRGTGNNEDMVKDIIDSVTPSAKDDTAEKQRKFENMISIMQDKLKLMDPEGQYGTVKVTLPWKAGAKKAPAKKDLYLEYGLTPAK